MAEETQLAEAGQDSEKPEFDLLPAKNGSNFTALRRGAGGEIISYMSPREKSKHLEHIW